MPTQLNTTELDFDKIKKSIKEYYQNTDSTFKDWNFEGAGLNILLDILAYNTHYNAMLAHLATNESFLSSAQLRKNVVGRAKTLGYIPHSMQAASTQITLTGGNLDQLTEVPRGTIFSTSVGDNRYIFTVTDTQAGPFNANNPVVAYQGKLKTIRYVFDSTADRQSFVIPDTNVDTSHLRINSYPPNSNESAVNYARFTTKAFSGCNGTVELSAAIEAADVYFISENSNGLYEIEFGNGVIGTKPAGGNIIEISYLITDGPEANGAITFKLDSELEVNGITVASATTATGGGERENIEQIRSMAPVSFIAQDRAVTANDYKAIVMNNSRADYVSVWGSEDRTDLNTIGTVYVSAYCNEVPHTLSTLEKDALLEIFANKGVLTLKHEMVDPEIVNLYFNIFAKYDPTLATSSASALEAYIKTTVVYDFGSANFQNFNSVFRMSRFLAAIDKSDPSILNSIAKIYAWKELNTANGNRVLDFTFAIDRDEEVTSAAYSTGGIDYYFETIGDFGAGESDDPHLSAQRAIQKYYVVNGTKEIDEAVAGIVDYQDGKVTLNAGVIEDDIQLAFYARPASDNVVARFNNVLEIDIEKTTVNIDADKIALLGNAGSKYYTTISRD